MDTRDLKKYHRLKLLLPLGESFFFLIVMILLVHFGISAYFEACVKDLSQNIIISFLLFVFIFGFVGYLVDFPVSYYLEFVIEKKYNLSNQNFKNWLIDKFKSILVIILITIPILLVFYLVLLEFGKLWWLPVGIFIFLFSTLLVRIAPIFIFPLFHKFVPIENSELKDNLKLLCRKYNFDVEGVFQFDMSKRTKKVNAGFAGIGKSRRIILSDNLLENFNKDEIISIFAHELGHYKLKHLWKITLFGFIIILLGLWLASIVYDYLITSYGFKSSAQLAALPLLGIILYLYGFLTLPINNFISRKYEFEADQFALSAIENKSQFVSALKKLAEINLADLDPNPIIEFLFYDHPSLSKRIAFAEKFLK